MTLGDIVKKHAIEKYRTDTFQRMLARDCGVSNATISRIVNDDGIHPDTQTLRKLSDVLGVNYVELLVANNDITVDDIVSVIIEQTRKGSKEG